MSKPPSLIPLRCDASFQSPGSYGGNGYGIEPPPASEGRHRCPECWKEVTLVKRSHVTGRVLPMHNRDHAMLAEKHRRFEEAERKSHPLFRLLDTMDDPRMNLVPLSDAEKLRRIRREYESYRNKVQSTTTK